MWKTRDRAKAEEEGASFLMEQFSPFLSPLSAGLKNLSLPFSHAREREREMKWKIMGAKNTKADEERERGRGFYSANRTRVG